MTIGVRRQGRFYALQVLYAADVSDLGAGPDADSAVQGYAERFELDVEPRAVVFAKELVDRVLDHLPQVDEVIQSVSRNWRLERMARVDRNILRLATAELLHAAEVPVRVIINEAVELAKRFGTTESPAFVNGILDRIAQRVAHDNARPR